MKNPVVHKADHVVAVATVTFYNNDRHEVKLENGPAISAHRVERAINAVFKAVGQSKAAVRSAKMQQTNRADMGAA